MLSLMPRCAWPPDLCVHTSFHPVHTIHYWLMYNCCRTEINFIPRWLSWQESSISFLQQKCFLLNYFAEQRESSKALSYTQIVETTISITNSWIYPAAPLGKKLCGLGDRHKKDLACLPSTSLPEDNCLTLCVVQTWYPRAPRTRDTNHKPHCTTHNLVGKCRSWKCRNPSLGLYLCVIPLQKRLGHCLPALQLINLLLGASAWTTGTWPGHQALLVAVWFNLSKTIQGLLHCTETHHGTKGTVPWPVRVSRWAGTRGMGRAWHWHVPIVPIMPHLWLQSSNESSMEKTNKQTKLSRSCKEHDSSQNWKHKIGLLLA